MLHIIPCCSKVEVDKGFLIENECALLGIGCVRPMKRSNLKVAPTLVALVWQRSVGTAGRMTDEGLVDVRPMVDLWGSNSEVKRYHELRSLSSNATLTDTEIAEMVLAEDWASKLRLQHELKVNDVNS